MSQQTPRAKLTEIQIAYNELRKTDAGRKVLTHIVFGICRHLAPARNESDHVRHQVAIEVLTQAGLIGIEEGSFPLEYISMLASIRAE